MGSNPASGSPLGHGGLCLFDPIPTTRSPKRSCRGIGPYFHFHSHFRFCFHFRRYVYSANRIRLSIRDRAGAARSSRARYFMPPLPICALYLRMLKYIGCSLSLKIGCGDTSACPDNYYRALAYCPILFLFTVRLALLSVTSEVCRVLQFRDSILL